MNTEEKNDTIVEETAVEDTAQNDTSGEEEELSPWYYFFSQGCGWCKKATPLVEELNSSGDYPEILLLDTAEPDNAKLRDELFAEYKTQCGTPFFINADTGESICGFREKDIVEKWLNGEEIPAPPRPKGPPPAPPQNWEDEKTVKDWEEKYEAWREENKHMPNLPDAKTTAERLKVQQQRQAQMANQGGGANNALVNNRLQVLEGKLGILETKLDQILQKLQG